MEETKETINKMYDDVLKKYRKEKDESEKEKLRKDLAFLEQRIKSAIEIANLEESKQNNVLDEEELKKKRKREKREDIMELTKIIFGAIAALTSLVGAGAGIAKLAFQNRWLQQAIMYETTGTWSTRTTGNIVNGITKI